MFRRYVVAAVVAFSLLFCGVSAAAAAVPRAYSDGEMHRMAKVFANDAALAQNGLGRNVVIDGDTAVMGAFADNERRGAVYVFVRRGESWVQQAKLAPADLLPGDTAATTDNSLAIDGDTLVFGVPFGSSMAGAAYVYTRTGTTWALQQKLIAPDAATYDYFGQTVAISGDSIAIGVPGDDHFGGAGFDFGGSVRIFTRSGTTWGQQTKLTVPLVAGELLGDSDLDLQTGTLVAGSGSGGVHATGAAYVFTRSGTTWSAPTQLAVAGGSDPDDGFGRSVEIDGDTIMVGAPFRGSGLVYVYRRSGSAWIQDAEITGVSGASFGARMCLDGDTAVFAAPYATDAATGKLIAVIDVYRRTGTRWAHVRRLAGSDSVVPATRFAEFDTFVGISGDSVVVGAPADDEFGDLTGSACFFDINEYKTAEESPLTVAAVHGVLANDYDADSHILTPRLLDTSRLHGVLAFGPGGSFIYTPEKDFAGTAMATYYDTDGVGRSNTATITITVTPVNDAPVAVPDSAKCRTNATATLNVLANDIDVDTAHALLRATGFSAPSIGAIQTLPSGDVVYTPPPNWGGVVSFTYRAFDGTALSPPAKVNITVGSAPVGFSDSARGMILAGGSMTATFTVGAAANLSLAGSGDPVPALVWSGDTLPAGLNSAAANGIGTITGVPAVGTAGTYDLKLTAANALGSAQITVRAVVLNRPAPDVVPEPPESTVVPEPVDATEDIPVAAEPIAPEPPSEETTNVLETSATVTPDETRTPGSGSGRKRNTPKTRTKPPGTITLPFLGDIHPSVVAAAPWCVGVFALLLATVGVFSARRKRDEEEDESLR